MLPLPLLGDVKYLHPLISGLELSAVLKALVAPTIGRPSIRGAKYRELRRANLYIGFLLSDG